MAVLVNDRTLAETLGLLDKYPTWVTDLETTGLSPRRDTICGWAIKGWDPISDEATPDFYFPVGHREGNIDAQRHLLKMAPGRVHIGWNIGGFDSTFMRRAGMEGDITVIDSMLDHHLLNENEPKQIGYGLKRLAEKYYRPDALDAERKLEALLRENLLEDKGEMWRLPPAMVAPYAGDDVELTLGMHRFHLPHLKSQGLEEVSKGISEYSLVIGKAVDRGILLDMDGLLEAQKWSEREMMRITQICWDRYGFKNINSPQKVCQWLGIKSSTEENLELLNDPKCKLILEFRRHQKARGSYYTKFRKVSENGILHPGFSLHGTISGRLNCRQPNAQALPTDTTVYRVKQNLIARPGYTLMIADIKQAEICVAAHYGQEEGMKKIIASGKKQHQVVSDDLGIPYAAAKRLNFSVIYGIKERTLAANMGIPIKQAAAYLNKYHMQYPGFQRLYNAAMKFARRNGYIRIYTGRRRHYNAGFLTKEHKASSNLIQGTVAEYMRKKQTALHNNLTAYDVHQLLQVHDSAVQEVPTDIVPKIAKWTKEIMEDDKLFSVPITIDVTVGPNLKDQEAI